jgi:lysophospholipase L1-like esterase
MKRLLTSLFLVAALTLNAQTITSQNSWVGSWATATQFTTKQTMPPVASLSNTSMRQIIHVSIGGDVLRLQLSNEYSKQPMEITSIFIADAKDSCDINAKTARYLTFNKQKGVVIPAGKTLMSDAVRYKLRPQQWLSITINYGPKTPYEPTSHPGSRTTSYILKGLAKPSTPFGKGIRTDHWFTLMALDVFSPVSSAIAVLGNSITDGRGSTTNHQNRWTDIMAETLSKDRKTADIGVLNLGIGGNCVLEGGLGEPAIARFNRDIMQQRGVKRLIIFEGTNDIGGSHENSETVARRLIETYKTFIKEAKTKGMKVYGATITPFKNHYYYTPFHEAARQVVNEWIRTSKDFDGVIDFDALMRDPKDPAALKKELQEDWLHPNAMGYREMGRYAAEIIK